MYKLINYCTKCYETIKGQNKRIHTLGENKTRASKVLGKKIKIKTNKLQYTARKLEN